MNNFEANINSQLRREILSGNKYDKYMPFSDCSSVLSLGEGDTKFAIHNMAKTVYKYAHHTDKLTKVFFSKGVNLEGLCEEIHEFLYNHFQYKLDGYTQKLRSPACSWNNRSTGIDCKSYSIFGSSILYNAGIKHYLRRIVQRSNPNGYTHVYVVVPKDQKKGSLVGGYYVIDGTINTMKELPNIGYDDVFVSPKSDKIYIDKGLGVVALRGLGAVERKNFKDITGILMSLPVAFQGAIQGCQADAEKIMSTTTDERIQKIGTIGEGISGALALAAKITAKPDPCGALPAVSVVLETLALGVQYLTMAFGVLYKAFHDPCKGSFYKHDRVKESIFNTFEPRFYYCLQSIAGFLDDKQGGRSVLLAMDYVNEMLKEIDLGYASYENELKRLEDGNDAEKCSYTVLLMFKTFAGLLKGYADNIYDIYKEGIDGEKGYLNISFEEIEASTTERKLYFVTPATQNPIMAKYRRIKISLKNNPKWKIDFSLGISFEQWYENLAQELTRKYGGDIGNRYRKDMERVIKQANEIIRNYNVVSQVSYSILETKVFPQCESIYLNYDLEYKAMLQKRDKMVVELIRKQQKKLAEDLVSFSVFGKEKKEEEDRKETTKQAGIIGVIALVLGGIYFMNKDYE